MAQRTVSQSVPARLFDAASKLVRKPVAHPAPRRYAQCIFKPDRIGDFVIALGAIRALIGRAGPEETVLVLSPFSSPLAELEFPGVPQIVVEPFRLRMTASGLGAAARQRRRLGELEFEQLVCLRHQRTRMQNLELHWIRSQKVVGLRNDPEYRLGPELEKPFSITGTYPATAPPGSCLELEAHRHTAELALGRPVPSEEILPRFLSTEPVAENYLLLCPFGSSPLRDLAAKSIAPALRMAQDQFQLPIELSCAPNQHLRADLLRAKLRERGIETRLSSTPTVAALVRRIGGARAVLSADTGPAHIAIALDRATVVVIGGGDYGRFGPWHRSAKQIWLTHRVECFNCGWYCHQKEPFCLTRIRPEEIESALGMVLAQDAS